MDSATPLNRNAAPVPKNRSLSICLNCGALYRLIDGTQVPMTEEEKASLPDITKDFLKVVETARRKVVDRDLAPQTGGW